jgi:hypothetical protein
MAWICKISNRRLNVYLSYTEGSNHVQQGSDLLVKAEKYVLDVMMYPRLRSRWALQIQSVGYR